MNDQHDTPHPTTTRRPRRRWAAGAVLASAAAVAGTLVTASPATATAERSAASVPWSQVGSGWMVATWAPNSTSDATVYLLSPTGTRYALTGVANDTKVIDWTTSGRDRLLVTSKLGLRQIDMQTGARQTLPGLAGAAVQGYARPSTTTVYVRLRNEHWAKYGLGGKRLVTYPTRVPGSGALDTALYPPVSTRTDGSLVFGAQHGLVVFGPRGHAVRKLLPTAGECLPSSLLRAGVVVARCGHGALYTVAVGGGRATKLTQGPGHTNPFGYDAAWTYSRGMLGMSPNGCGPDSLVRFDARGSGTRVVPPAPTSVPAGSIGTSSYFGHHGDLVEAVFWRGACQTSALTLYTWNAVTGRSTALLGPGANGGTVTSVAPSAFDNIYV